MNKHKLGAYLAPHHDPSKWQEYLRAIQPPLVRILMPGDTDYSTVSQVYQCCPDAMISLRWWNVDDGGEGQKMSKIADPINSAIADAKIYMGRVSNMAREAQRQGLPFPSHHKIALNALNEPPTWLHDKRAGIAEYNLRFVEHIANYSDYIAFAGEIAVGHPEEWPPVWDWFRYVFEALRKYGGYLALHEYWQEEGIYYAPEPGREDWGALCGRYLHCPFGGNIVITESGLDGRIYNRHTPPDCGYRALVDVDRYADQTKQYLLEISKDDRILACTPFLTDYQNKEWASYDTLPAKDAFVRMLGVLDLTAPVRPTPPPVQPPVEPQPTPPPILSEKLVWPAAGPVTQRWGENPEFYQQKLGIPYHNGVDIGCDVGTPVVASASGIVKWVATDEEGYGLYTRIYYPGFRIHLLLAHLSECLVNIGEEVAQGQVVGYSGNSGLSSGPHLHIETRLGDEHHYGQGTFGHTNGRVDPQAIYWVAGVSQHPAPGPGR